MSSNNHFEEEFSVVLYKNNLWMKGKKNFFGEDYFCPCICYNVTANTGDTITWTDCDGIEQTALYSGKLPLYCARPNTISVAGTFTAVAQGDCNPITSECITTTTTLFIG